MHFSTRCGVLLISAAASFLWAAGTVGAAGFNCSKASRADEKLVCADRQLSRLDSLFTKRLAEELLRSDDADGTRHQARNFLSDRHACGSSRSCVLGAYLAALWEISGDKGDFMKGISAGSLQPVARVSTTVIPGHVGECASTTVTAVHPRLGEEGAAVSDEDYDAGTGIDYANDGYQVSYNREEALIASKPGDAVTMCLIEIDRDCEPDEAGRLFLVTNSRTRATWVLPDAQHKCGR